MRVLYPFKVNTALAQMRFRPDMFDGSWRSGMQQLGYDAGCTPQETAVAIVAHGLRIGFPFEAEKVIGGWIKAGKLNPKRPEMVEALQKMGFDI
jgi:hypothetical protein